MSDAPEKIWAWKTENCKGVSYTRTDLHLALVAAALEKTASKMDVRHRKDMISKGRNPDDYTSPWSEVAKDIRAFISADAQDALKRVKREARNEALRDAARYLQSQCGCSEVTCLAESDCNMDRQRAREILALMEDEDDE